LDRFFEGGQLRFAFGSALLFGSVSALFVLQLPLPLLLLLLETTLLHPRGTVRTGTGRRGLVQDRSALGGSLPVGRRRSTTTTTTSSSFAVLEVAATATPRDVAPSTAVVRITPAASKVAAAAAAAAAMIPVFGISRG